MIKTKYKVTVLPHISILKAMDIIGRGIFRLVFVIDKRNRLLGVVTDGDIRRGILRGVPLENAVETVMNKDPLCIEDSWSEEKIQKFFKSKKMIERGPFEHLVIPVIDADRRIIDLLNYSNGEFTSLSKIKPSLIEKKKKIKRVLVIGGAGYVGSVLVRLLLNQGYLVNVLDLFLFGHDSLRDLYGDKRLKIIKGDSRHIKDVSEAMRDADAVVHLAELVGDPACEYEPREAIEINCLATKLVALTSKHFRIKRFIYASSCSVYGASESEALLREESALNPVSLYARIKVESEKSLLEMAGDNFAPTILRLATVYGESFRPRFDLVVNLLTAKAVAEKQITVFGGDQWRPNIHVEDVGKLVIRTLEAPLEKVQGQIFNGGSNAQNYKIKDLGKIVQKLIPEAKLVITENGGDRRNYRVDFTKTRKILGFKPSKKIEDGVQALKKLLESKKLEYTSKYYSNIKTLQSRLKK